MIYRKICVVLLILCSAHTVFADNRSDSLLNNWNNSSLESEERLQSISDLIQENYIKTRPDSTNYFAQLQFELAKEIGSDKWQSKARYYQALAMQNMGRMAEGLTYAEEALKHAQVLEDSLQMAKIYSLQGSLYMYSGDYESCIEVLTKGISIYSVLKDQQGLSSCLTTIGTAYGQQGKYSQALVFLNRGRKIAEQTKNKQQLLTAINSIGIIYFAQKEYDLALECYLQVLDGSVELGDQRGIAGSCSNIGGVYEYKLEYDSAIKYFLRSLKIAEEQGLVRGILALTSNLGNTYLSLGDLEEALVYTNRALDLAEKMGMGSMGIPPLVVRAKIYRANNQNDKAIEYANSALKLAQEMGETQSIEPAASLLSEIYKSTGRYKQSLEMYELAVQMRDSLASMDNQKAIIQQQFVFEYEKKFLADSLKQEEEKLQVQIAHQAEVHRKNQGRNLLAAGVLMLLVVAGGLYGRMGYIRKTKRIIEKEMERSDDLLLNILPEEIAKELKLNGKADAKHFDMASVLFTDFKSFTEMSSSLEAKDLVEEINICFKAFDQIVTDHNIEKIKTIGDSYMATGGLSAKQDESVKNTVLSALSMQTFITERKAALESEGKPAFEMRVGVHTGPVVAGIVGVKKFQYDIWGDTVNTASRMESHGEVDRVNISQTTYELIKDDPKFVFEHRGKIDAKGKGEIDMYYVSLA